MLPKLDSPLTVELTIDRLSVLGEGVAQYQARAVFVEGGIPGDRLLLQLSGTGKNDKVWRGLILQILSPGPGRRLSPCHLSALCGGCNWLQLDEVAQREAKTVIAVSTLKHLGGLSSDAYALLPLIASPVSLGYRRRASFRWTNQGLAFHAKGSHQLVAIDRCIALLPRLQALPEQLNPLLGPLSRDLESVHLLGDGDQSSIALFLKGKAKIKPDFCEKLESVCARLKLKGAVVVPSMGSGTAAIVRDPVLKTQHPFMEAVTLYLRPDGFAQANAEANPALVSVALEMLAPTSQDRVLELYSGNGNFTFALSARAKEILGIESSSLALDLANRSVRQAKVSNVRFILGQATAVLKGLILEGAKFDLLLVDPPRTGAPELAQYLSKLSIKKMVYVSCDIASLARDCRALKSAGYRLEAVQLVDMFPQTNHIEAIACFTDQNL